MRVAAAADALGIARRDLLWLSFALVARPPPPMPPPRTLSLSSAHGRHDGEDRDVAVLAPGEPLGPLCGLGTAARAALKERAKLELGSTDAMSAFMRRLPRDQVRLSSK